MNIPTTLKKPTRQVAHYIVKEALKGAADGGQLVTLSVLDVQALLLFTAPAAPARPKTPWQWLAKAVAKRNEVRYYLHYVYCDGVHAMATDGHVACRTTAEQAGLSEAGYYCPQTGSKVDCDAKYPDLGRFIGETDAGGSLNWAEWDRRDYPNVGIARQAPEGDWFDEKLLTRAAPGGQFTNERERTTGATLQGRCDFGRFAVMPLNGKP